MNHPLFHSSMKMSEIIDINPNVLMLLPRLGIPLGFGEETVKSVCDRQDVPPEFFILLCNIYSFDDYIPSEKEIASINMKMLLPYLQSSHSYYLDEKLLHIEEHISRIAENVDAQTGRMLRDFFLNYKAEVQNHFKFEEEAVFPYLEAIADGKNVAKDNPERFEEDHHNLADTLSDLKEILFRYLPVTDSSESVEVIFDILQLTKDFDKHSFIEEKVLLPYLKLQIPAGIRESVRSSVEAGEVELSPREQDVLVMVAKGHISKEIADELNISIHTVNTHRKNITAKTGIRSVAGLTLYALLHNLI